MVLPQDNFAKVASVIETWFHQSARDFPWRKESFPWGRLVSEFMAQQTQIARVAERWAEMMRHFPTPLSMAKQDIQAILVLWQGLGYYRRAKHLQQAAQMIAKDFGGEVPSSLEALLLLPGVGRYTAGAIASIAFGQKVPIVDANVHRVLCRLGNEKKYPSPCAWSWNGAELLVHACENPSTFNEGLMELGATICTPKSPRCAVCPVKDHCAAFELQTQNDIPATIETKPRKRVHHHAVVLTCGNEIAFEQRGSEGLWANMWQVPTCESSSKLSVAQVASTLGIPKALKSLGQFEHLLTHRVIEFRVYSCEIKREARFIWYSMDAVDEIPLASAQRKVLDVHCRA